MKKHKDAKDAKFLRGYSTTLHIALDLSDTEAGADDSAGGGSAGPGGPGGTAGMGPGETPLPRPGTTPTP